MKDDSLMRRLRAGRPVAAEPGDHAALLARIVAEPGDPRLGEADHERSPRLLGRKVRPWTRARPRVLAGSTLGLAGIGAALVLALGGSATPPAFAVTRHHDGSVAVKIYRTSGIVFANRKLASMGIHERLTVVKDGQSLPQSCLKNQQTGRVVVSVFSSAAAQQREIVNGTYIPPSTAGNTGGVPQPGPWHVVACSSVVTGNPGSGNTGNTGAG